MNLRNYSPDTNHSAPLFLPNFGTKNGINRFQLIYGEFFFGDNSISFSDKKAENKSANF